MERLGELTEAEGEIRGMSTYFLSRGLAFRCEVRSPHSYWAGGGKNVPEGVFIGQQ